MKLTLQQTNQLIRESIIRFNKADRKMTLLSERRITIEKLLISEGFSVSAVLNYQVGLQPGDEPVTVTDAEALKAHAAIPSLHKVKPPKNAEGGFTDPRLPIFNLIFDQNNNEDGLVVSNSGKMTGVDTDFDVSAAFTTAKPGYGTPPCVEMLLNAIKQKDENTPYRIDDATLSDYEQSAASKLTISLRGMSS